MVQTAAAIMGKASDEPRRTAGKKEKSYSATAQKTKRKAEEGRLIQRDKDKDASGGQGDAEPVESSKRRGESNRTNTGKTAKGKPQSGKRLESWEREGFALEKRN